jgi:hypothetical protein
VLLGGVDLAGPQQDRDGGQHNGKRHRMVHPFSIFDRLMSGCRRSRRMALQPERCGQRDPGPTVMIKSKIDRPAGCRAWSRFERRHQFHAGAAEIAHEMA